MSIFEKKIVDKFRKFYLQKMKMKSVRLYSAFVLSVKLKEEIGFPQTSLNAVFSIYANRLIYVSQKKSRT